MIILNAFRGFCMALADSVPGVSGGTIAFLLGFYDKFIGSLNNLISGTKEQRKEALIFLIKLGVGWVIGLLGSMLVLSKIFESHIYIVSSLFLGLTLFAIPVVIREEWKTVKGHWSCLIFTVIGIAIVVLLSILRNMIGSDGVSFEHFNIGLILFTFVAGMVAISAMVLPGISGSTILLAFGVYVPTINAVNGILKEHSFSTLPYIISLALGIIVGVILIIRAVKSALEKYRPASIYTIIGLMIGSLYAITQGPTTLDEPLEAMSLSTFHIIPFIGGAVILAGLEFIRYFLEKKNIK